MATLRARHRNRIPNEESQRRKAKTTPADFTKVSSQAQVGPLGLSGVVDLQRATTNRALRRLIISRETGRARNRQALSIGTTRPADVQRNLLTDLLKRRDKDAAGTIAYETLYPAPDSSLKNRQKVGVGEEVEFTAPRSGTWMANAGSPASRESSDLFKWEAPARKSKAAITFTANRKSSVVSMKVVEPQSIEATKEAEMPLATGRQGAGMALRFKYHPLDVSFGKVEAGKLSGPASKVSGFYKKRYTKDDLRHDTNDRFWRIKLNNESSVHDIAKGGGERRPWSKGSYRWIVPNRFRVQGETGEGKKFTKVTQVFNLEADGTQKIAKAGAAVGRSP